MMRRYWIPVFVCAMLLIGWGGVSQVAASDFDKKPGSFYMGGTAGLTGVDSARGYADSVYYAKWWETGEVPSTIFTDPNKVIYGDDDRRDVYQITDPNLLKLAQAACVVVSLDEISDNGNGTYTLNVEQWLYQSGSPICPDEPFRGQLRIGNCSGFLVGDDIIVTAGHCLNASTCGSWAFLFGFQQIDSLTGPDVIVPADNIYFCTQIIDRVQAGDLDHCVSRVDRPVVGRTPIPIRREGTVANGDSLVVVGHPAVLPMKIAGGAIVQNNNGSTPWFQANTDTYGGNSGSMVVNTNTWTIEGILVRGAPDYINSGGCTASNRVPNTGNTGSGLQFEEISKTTAFAQYIPELVNSTGVMFVSGSKVSCADSLSIEVRDIDLAGSGQHAVEVTTSGGDVEAAMLYESGPASGIFNNKIATSGDAFVEYDSLLEITDGETITVTYQDADNGSGSPAVVEEYASVDCVGPGIYDVTVDTANGVSATITFLTSEPAGGRVELGTSCGIYTISAQDGQSTSHTVLVGGLAPLTVYAYRVIATDIAGNQTIDDNGGACYQAATTDQPDYFTQAFTAGNDLAGGTITFRPDGSADFYEACREPAAAFPTDPTGGTQLHLDDDSTTMVALTGGAHVYLYDQSYATAYVCSNGFVGFGFNSDDYSETIGEHFSTGARVDAYWDDLNPSSQGTISYKQRDDRFVVTWQNVPEFQTTNSNNFQVEMFFDGAITITHLAMASADGLVGLSRGGGQPSDFVESDMSAYPTCTVIEPPGCCVGMRGNVDNDPDDIVSLGDLTALIDHLFISLAPISCPEEGDVDGSGGESLTLGDLTALIDVLFISLDPPPACE